MTGIFFIARLESKRLEQKHLINVKGKCIIEWLYERFLFEFKQEIENVNIKLIITTAKKKVNKGLEKTIKNKNIEICYGDTQNIPNRMLQCAIKNNISKIIAVDGDDILCSTSYTRKVIQELENNSYVSTRGLPLGMNITGFTTELLQKLNPSKYKRLETGWAKIFDNEDSYLIKSNLNLEFDNIRITLDYKEDLKFFESIIGHLGNKILKIKDEDLLNTIKKNQFHKINSFLSEVYWKNFNKQKALDDK